MRRADHDADAGRGKHVVSVDVECPGEFFMNPVRNGGGLVQCLQMLKQYGEFIAAIAGDQVMRAQTAAQALGDGHQQAVAKTVAQAVIDQLETVEVQEQHGEALLLRLPALLQNLAEPVKEEVAVRQAGQGVVVGAVDQFLFGFLCSVMSRTVAHGGRPAAPGYPADGDGGGNLVIHIPAPQEDFLGFHSTVPDLVREDGSHQLAAGLGHDVGNRQTRHVVGFKAEHVGESPVDVNIFAALAQKYPVLAHVDQGAVFFLGPYQRFFRALAPGDVLQGAGIK